MNLIKRPLDAPRGRYERAVRAYFSAQAGEPSLLKDGAGHPASTSKVESGEAVSAKDAPLPEPGHDSAASLEGAQSATSSRTVQQFMHANRRLYADVAVRAEVIAAQGAAEWATYTGLGVRAQKVVLSPAVGLADDGCQLALARLGKNRLVAWPGTELTPSELFLQAGFARDQFESAPASVSERAMLAASERQIVLAVFARVAALSQGDKAAEAALRDAAGHGDALVPLYYRRLITFEHRRDQFPTLREFLPYLVRGLRPQSIKFPGDVASATKDSSCAASQGALVASATR
jgi:hypothetical protein